jgi:hypothetical protein
MTHRVYVVALIALVAVSGSVATGQDPNLLFDDLASELNTLNHDLNQVGRRPLL